MTGAQVFDLRTDVPALARIVGLQSTPYVSVLAHQESAMSNMSVRLAILWHEKSGLDEADEMLSRGFTKQIYDIFQLLPQSTQVVLLPATMPQNVLEVTTKFMRDPVRILVKKDELTLEGIKQFYIAVEKEVAKLNWLVKCTKMWSISIIRSRQTTAAVHAQCFKIHSVEWIHGTREVLCGVATILVMCHTRELAYQIRNEYNCVSYGITSFLPIRTRTPTSLSVRLAVSMLSLLASIPLIESFSIDTYTFVLPI